MHCFALLGIFALICCLRGRGCGRERLASWPSPSLLLRAHSGVQKQYVSHCVNDASCTYEPGSKGLHGMRRKNCCWGWDWSRWGETRVKQNSGKRDLQNWGGLLNRGLLEVFIIILLYCSRQKILFVPSREPCQVCLLSRRLCNPLTFIHISKAATSPSFL